MTDLPTDDEIRALHERFAPTPAAFELVWTHCLIVRDLALSFPAPGTDPDLVRAGALLHDIGVYRLRPDEAYIRHGVLGHELLRSLDLPEPLARICSHHTGVGLTRDDILTQALPLPPADYLDETPTETVIMYADKFHSKTTPPRFWTAKSYAESLARFGPAKVARFAELVATYGEPDVDSLARRYGNQVR
ncbi:HDIG domain-containing metalloprotein [Paractinoplanes lichenicola]|uniref:HDIG domain-containing protein n=1 Tax=Paractinoplanes lichenicola TaxID=2802976 RepID=A0ABS1VWV2_9ACTN|nr:HDIG domain-containing metalloprotein [Actinoplanes lichenicola]MBL7258940.1 HDIG domain-containing protein [Actinoplanes lichenicola]